MYTTLQLVSLINCIFLLLMFVLFLSNQRKEVPFLLKLSDITKYIVYSFGLKVIVNIGLCCYHNDWFRWIIILLDCWLIYTYIEIHKRYLEEEK